MLNKLKRAALGAHTPHDKATAASKPIPMPLPAQVRILMSQHIGAPAKALVKKGDEVFVGTKIGEAGGFVSANIHSSVSGTVAADNRDDLALMHFGGYVPQSLMMTVKGVDMLNFQQVS